jgi:hypothetical protein
MNRNVLSTNHDEILSMTHEEGGNQLITAHMHLSHMMVKRNNIKHDKGKKLPWIDSVEMRISAFSCH